MSTASHSETAPRPRALEGDALLRLIATATAGQTGEGFFESLAQSLAVALGTRWGFVSQFLDDLTKVCMIAYWDGSQFVPAFDYALAHTPCEGVLNGEIGFYPDNVQSAFPDHHELVDEGIVSYLAIPMTAPSGEVIGHIGAMDDRPMAHSERDANIFRIFGARAGAELLRHRAELALSEREQQLQNILNTAMDAFIFVDAEHRITMFNLAAERMFRCRADWALGQPLERFVPRRQRTQLQGYLDGDHKNFHAWLPEGLSAVRADGSEFPIEGTLSPALFKGRQQHTVILRDINERVKAESAMRQALAKQDTLEEVLRRNQEFSGVIGDSAEMCALLEQVARVAKTEATVLITGETGCGKELIALAIHDSSPRKSKPMVTVNCAALPSELIESELFGHERGAFTGATNLRRGRFELADGGTIFLDEAGELSPQAQAKLLRVLQEQRFERVGGGAPIKVNVRVIAATNRDLGAMVREGGFRADLYYRLCVFPLRVPPLRERRSDIEALASHFVEKFARKLGVHIDGISPLSLERLRRYHWPGNVRELQNVIERAAILTNGPLLMVPESQLPTSPDESDGDGDGELDMAPAATGGALNEVTRSHIAAVLEGHDWVIEGPDGAAAVLGLKPSTLRYRMKLLGIKKPGRAAQ
jgi:PAS domain S-box